MARDRRPLHRRYARFVSLQQRPRVGIQRYWRALARRLRHARRPVQRDVTGCGTGSSALSFALHIRSARLAKIRPEIVPPRWSDSRAPARQSLGTGLGQCLPLLGLPEPAAATT
jgi:hypothetical protein